MYQELSEEEAPRVAMVRDFIDRDVKATVREAGHANSYPETWIEPMQRIGVLQARDHRRVRRDLRCRRPATCWRLRNWPAAGTRCAIRPTGHKA